MKKVEVNVSKPYNVIIGDGILSNVGKHIAKEKKPCKAIIISDNSVEELYGEVVEKSLENEGYTVLKFIFPPGEKSKTLNVAMDILNFLAENKISRSDILIALGGGVVGDITGFCAAVYLRGIAFVQIPTTILSAVDSSVGGKTGVDLVAGKNLVGAFHHPILVLCDIEAFKTLEKDVYKDGLCEVIKYGCILDNELFQLLLEGDFESRTEEIVERCISLKAQIVCQDEFDNGIRQILNFGHTIGHAIESLSDYSISHGKAVGIGMYMIEKAAGSGFHMEIKEILEKYKIDIATNYKGFEIAEKAKSDKKISGDSINLILLEKIGKAKIVSIPLEDIKDFFVKGEQSG